MKPASGTLQFVVTKTTRYCCQVISTANWTKYKSPILFQTDVISEKSRLGDLYMSTISENSGILSSNQNSPDRPAKKLGKKNQPFKKGNKPQSYYFTVPYSMLPFCKDQNNHPSWSSFTNRRHAQECTGYIKNKSCLQSDQKLRIFNRAQKLHWYFYLVDVFPIN